MLMRLSSPVFDDGEPIPDKYGYEKDNVNPPLAIGDVPSDATSLALVIDDPDAQEPAGKIWDHWVVWNVDPSTSEIEEGSTPPNAREGRNDFDETGYGGPKPPDRTHTYHFRLYAVDTNLDLDTGASKADLREALETHILDEAELNGTYAPNA
jgi:Raf kinase inhibitor-like YbhB/YbcL family protein